MAVPLKRSDLFNEDLEEALAQAPEDVNLWTPLPRGLGLQQGSL